MYTAIEDTGTITIKEKYILPDGTECGQVTHYRKKDDGNVAKLIVLEHDQKQLTAKEMNELIQNGAMCFDYPKDFDLWIKKNPLKLDEDGKPVDEKTVLSTIIDWMAI